jgi:hypothetical protein
MSTFVRTVDLLGPALTAVWRATRGITLIIASLAVTVAACAPVAATGPALPDPDPIEETEGIEEEPPPDLPPIPAPDCERTGPMVPC